MEADPETTFGARKERLDAEQPRASWTRVTNGKIFSAVTPVTCFYAPALLRILMSRSLSSRLLGACRLRYPNPAAELLGNHGNLSG